MHTDENGEGDSKPASTDDSEEEDGGVPAGTRKRLLDEKKWQRDNKLYNIGLKFADALGSDIFDEAAHLRRAVLDQH